jgi:hypothetical protein
MRKCGLQAATATCEATNERGSCSALSASWEFLKKNTAVKTGADAVQLFDQEHDISLVAVTRPVGV